MTMLTRALGRVRRDYFAASREEEYAAALGRARKLGYELWSLDDVYRMEPVSDTMKILALRHDIDVCHPSANETFFQIEASVGARATYYFRLSTAPSHMRLIARLRRDGFEGGYHFEEAATLAKARGLRTRQEVLEHRGEIIEQFQANCAMFRARYNPELTSVCAHGDWINRRLGFVNNEVLDADLLRACGLRFEAYGLRSHFDRIVTDVYHDGRAFDAALDVGVRRICLLTHERQWFPSRRVATRANIERILDEVRYRLRRRRRSPGHDLYEQLRVR